MQQMSPFRESRDDAEKLMTQISVRRYPGFSIAWLYLQSHRRQDPLTALSALPSIREEILMLTLTFTLILMLFAVLVLLLVSIISRLQHLLLTSIERSHETSNC